MPPITEASPNMDGAATGPGPASSFAKAMDGWRPDGQGRFTLYRKGAGGQEYPVNTISGSAFQQLLQNNATKAGLKGDELAAALKPYQQSGLNFSVSSDGRIQANLSGSGGASSISRDAAPAAAAPAPAPTLNHGWNGGGQQVGTPGTAPGGGSSSTSRSQGYNAGAPAAGGGGLVASRDTTEIGVGGGGNGAGPPIDPNAPLGLDPSRGAAPGMRGGSDAFRSDLFPGPGSVLEGINPNSTLNDVLLGTVRRQEAARDAALGVYGGLFEGFENDPLRQQVAGRAGELLANPFSLDDPTIDRIRGKAAEGIGQNSERLQMLSRDRAASMGMGRGGMALANEDRIRMDAARQIGDVDRDLRIEQATRRPQELAAAIGTGSGVVGQQQGARVDIGGRAADVLANQDISADALLAGTLAGGGTTGQRQMFVPMSGASHNTQGNVSWMNPFAR